MKCRRGKYLRRTNQGIDIGRSRRARVSRLNPCRRRENTKNYKENEKNYRPENPPKMAISCAHAFMPPGDFLRRQWNLLSIPLPRYLRKQLAKPFLSVNFHSDGKDAKNQAASQRWNYGNKNPIQKDSSLFANEPSAAFQTLFERPSGNRTKPHREKSGAHAQHHVQEGQ